MRSDVRCMRKEKKRDRVENIFTAKGKAERKLQNFFQDTSKPLFEAIGPIQDSSNITIETETKTMRRFSKRLACSPKGNVNTNSHK